MINEVDSKFISFIELKPKPKTKVFEIRNKSYGDLLGKIMWYAPWRRYCFFVDSACFDAACLADIHNFMNRLMIERKKKIIS